MKLTTKQRNQIRNLWSEGCSDIEIAEAQAKRVMDNLGGVITEYEIRAYKNDMFKHYIVIHRGVI